jgi:hypothetical protein
MYIKHVSSTIKGGLDVELGPKTLIVGPSKSGKTSIPQAVELALTSAVSDIAGRDTVADAGLLGTLAEGNRPQATVTFSEGSIATYRGKRSWSVPSFVQSDRVLPLRSLREAVTGSAERAQKFLLNALGTVSQAVIEENIPEGLLPQFRIVYGGSLTTAKEDAARRARGAKQEIEHAQQLVDTMGIGAPIEQIDDTNYDEKRTQLFSELSKYQTLAEQARAYAWVVEHQKRHQAIVDEVTKLEQELAQVPPIENTFMKRKPRLDALLVVGEMNTSGPNCMACGIPSNPEIRQEKLVRLKAYIQQQYAQQTEAVQRDTYRRNTANRIQTLQNELRTNPQNLPAQPPISEQEARQRETQIRGFLAELEEKSSKSKASAVISQQAKKAHDTIAQLEQLHERWKLLADVLASLVQTLVDQQKQAFIDKVQSFLPKDTTFGLVLDPFRFGFVKNGQLHVALSGAEWVTALCAIGSALVEKDTFSVIIPEERAFDSTTLMETMRALTSSPSQIILTSVVDPDEVPTGWTIIRTDGERATVIPAAIRARKKNSGKALDLRLKELGWSPSDILGMTEDTKAEIFDMGISSSFSAITAEGKIIGRDMLN